MFPHTPAAVLRYEQQSQVKTQRLKLSSINSLNICWAFYKNVCVLEQYFLWTASSVSSFENAEWKSLKRDTDGDGVILMRLILNENSISKWVFGLQYTLDLSLVVLVRLEENCPFTFVEWPVQIPDK